MYKHLNAKQRDVMVQVLLMANHIDNEWEWLGELYTCKPGQFITSLQSIAANCAGDVKVQSVRTALLKLEKWGFLTNESTKTGRLITVINWHRYQSEGKETNKETNKQLTKSQQRANKELTTNKNIKNVKNDKERKNIYAENVKMKESEYKKLLDEYGQEVLDWMVEKLDNYKGAKGKRYKSDYRAILSWVVDDAKKRGIIQEVVTF